MKIRHYRQGEEEILWQIFFNTVRTINLGDYSNEQVKAWAPDTVNQEDWRKRIAAMDPFVCLNDEEIVGYAGLLDNGYVDHFYVHHQWQGKGVGKLLMQAIETTAQRRGLTELTSDVSITAMPFFHSRGFEVVTPQQVVLRGVEFANSIMKKTLVVNDC